jgi:hypothetical protein
MSHQYAALLSTVCQYQPIDDEGTYLYRYIVQDVNFVQSSVPVAEYVGDGADIVALMDSINDGAAPCSGMWILLDGGACTYLSDTWLGMSAIQLARSFVAEFPQVYASAELAAAGVFTP